jgi:hypothetical protein
VWRLQLGAGLSSSGAAYCVAPFIVDLTFASQLETPLRKLLEYCQAQCASYKVSLDKEHTAQQRALQLTVNALMPPKTTTISSTTRRNFYRLVRALVCFGALAPVLV